MPFNEVNAFMTDLIKRPALAARALEFTVLTAARTGEVLGARWAEIDLATAVWTVPADRMKGGVEHRVPLSTQALSVLGRVTFMPAPDDFIFGDPGDGGPLSNMAMRALMKRMKFERFAVHGFRSTFRDWCGELTDFAWDVIETALAHKVGTDVHRAYRRGDALEKRRELMEAWSKFCTGSSAAVMAA
jgi:integrase